MPTRAERIEKKAASIAASNLSVARNQWLQENQLALCCPRLFPSPIPFSLTIEDFLPAARRAAEQERQERADDLRFLRSLPRSLRDPIRGLRAKLWLAYSEGEYDHAAVLRVSLKEAELAANRFWIAAHQNQASAA